MQGSRTVKFGEVCEHSAFGPRFSSAAYAPDGNVATLRTTDITPDGRIEYATMPIALLDLERFKQHILRRDDLVITRTGRVGTTAVFTGFSLPVLPGAFLIRFRLKREIADPMFFRYFFNSSDGQALIASVATGSVQQNLNITALHKLEVPLPTLHEQRAVARTLGALDGKIHLNSRANQTIADLTNALFEHQFPYNPEDDLPPGWQTGNVESLATISRATVNPADNPDEELDHYSIPAFDQAQLPITETGSAILSNKWVVPVGAVLISKLNPRIPRVWFPRLNPVRRSICSTEFFPLLPRSGFTAEYIYCLCTSPAFGDEFATLTTGTSGSHQRVRQDFMTAMEIAVPPPPVLEHFNRTVQPLLDQVKSNREESRTLAALRDALLPKLLSGEIRVKDMEKQLEAV